MCLLLTANSLSGRGFPRKGHLLHVMKSSLLKVKLFSDQTPYPEVTLQTPAKPSGWLAAPNNAHKFSLLCLQQGSPAQDQPTPELHKELEGAQNKICTSLRARMTFLDPEPHTKNKTCAEFVVVLNELVTVFRVE